MTNPNKYWARAQELKLTTSVSDWDDEGTDPIDPDLLDEAAEIAWLLSPVYQDVGIFPAADGTVHLNCYEGGVLTCLEISRSRIGDKVKS